MTIFIFEALLDGQESFYDSFVRKATYMLDIDPITGDRCYLKIPNAEIISNNNHPNFFNIENSFSDFVRADLESETDIFVSCAEPKLLIVDLAGVNFSPYSEKYKLAEIFSLSSKDLNSIVFLVYDSSNSVDEKDFVAIFRNIIEAKYDINASRLNCLSFNP